jgi:glycosyltransferase involved in cell wall biosynthesis
MNIDISFYIPAYNAEKTIQKCVDSILNQTISAKKILVINDCSTDNTKKILLSYGKKVEIIDNPKNLGVSYARNLATSHLKTKYVASIDADVELTKNWTKILVSKSEENHVTLIGGKLYEKYIDNSYNLWRSLRLKQNWGNKDLLNPKFVFGCNNILDTSKIIIKDNYRNDLEYFKTNGEDVEFSNSLKNQKLDLYYSSEATCYHLQDDNGLSLSKRYWRYMHYGDGLKKRNFFKTIKNIIRQIKKTLKWSFNDLISLNFKLIKVNFIIFYNFLILDLKFYNENKEK